MNTVNNIFIGCTLNKELNFKLQNLHNDDLSYIPELIYILVNEVKVFKLRNFELEELLKMLYNHFIKQYNLINLLERPLFERFADMCIKLAVFKPNIKGSRCIT
jgi:hypothetical protein